ncbi:hypothetical protein NG799_21660 [Laspinema sp. D1]|uniref:Uncharacterized protein n=1 Tax=Laspinema palackyanum D2a TaxID=2953684 RepID=A0ABT2MW02_9CYAN|nr:hypothetical protein [Laspinema sp. D2a]
MNISDLDSFVNLTGKITAEYINQAQKISETLEQALSVWPIRLFAG